MQIRLGAVTLGCDKNRVDTERILAEAESAGAVLVADLSIADVIVVNTCAFIESAKKESIATILEIAALKNKNLKYLIVSGCFSERYADGMRDMFPEVDAVVGINGPQHVAEILRALPEGFNATHEKPLPSGKERVLTTPPHYAFLKIADGCDNCCSYCAIPRIRGRFRSEPFEKLLAEAKGLCLQGVKELIVVAQDTTTYGRDLYGRVRLVELLSSLCDMDFEKIRLLYTYPEGVTDELIDFIAATPKMAKYIDMPLQHVSDSILKAMKRRIDRNGIDTVLAKLRAVNADIAIRSTFIVGFPGETEDDYAQLKAFIEQGNIDYAGFFSYSKEEGTPAYNMAGQIPAKVKKQRLKALEQAQSAVIEKFHSRFVGKIVKVIYEGLDEIKPRFYGRIEQQSPEIDCKVLLTSKRPLDVGEIYDVRITSGGFDLEGEVF